MYVVQFGVTIHRMSQKLGLQLLSQFFQILTIDFQNSFTGTFCEKFSIHNCYPITLKLSRYAIPCKIFILKNRYNYVSFYIDVRSSRLIL